MVSGESRQMRWTLQGVTRHTNVTPSLVTRLRSHFVSCQTTMPVVLPICVPPRSPPNPKIPQLLMTLQMPSNITEIYGLVNVCFFTNHWRVCWSLFMVQSQVVPRRVMLEEALFMRLPSSKRMQELVSSNARWFDTLPSRRPWFDAIMTARLAPVIRSSNRVSRNALTKFIFWSLD